MKLLIATGNRHKLNEIRRIFDMPSLDLLALAEFPNAPEVVEDGATFEANAIKKAVSAAGFTGLWAMADDSGLEVNVLNGEPGVYSARYAGEECDYAANNSKLLSALKDANDRSAGFTCVIALSDPEGKTRVVKGRCTGAISDRPRGDNGFGYDPLFVPDGYSETFAEMDPDTKNEISHRAAALRKAREQWISLLSRPG